MNKETLATIIQNEAQKREAQARSRLACFTHRVMNGVFDAEANALTGAVIMAEETIIENVPLFVHLVNGKTSSTRSRPKLHNILRQVSELNLEEVVNTQQQLDALFSTVTAIPTFDQAKRLERFLPIQIPKTLKSYGVLRSIAHACKKDLPTEKIDQVDKNAGQMGHALGILDRETMNRALSDKDIIKLVAQEARKKAVVKFALLQGEDSPQVAALRSQAAERKIRELRIEPVSIPGNPARSRFELLVNSTVFDTDQLALSALVMHRAVNNVATQLEIDSQLLLAAARQMSMNEKQLSEADEITKKEAARKLIVNSGRGISLSVRSRRRFSGESVLADERKKLEESSETLSSGNNLTKEEKDLVRKIHQSGAFELANTQLRKNTENQVTGEDMIRVLTESITRQLLQQRSSNAVDLAIGDLNIDQSSLLEDPSILLREKESLVETAMKRMRLGNLGRIPHMEIEGDDTDSPLAVLGLDQIVCLTEKNIVAILEHTQGIQIEHRKGVKIYMVDQKARETISRLGRVLADLSKITSSLVLPETGNEMSCLATMLVDAIETGEPITLVTPICPDWSRDNEGRYDFESLGGNESFIAKKFFTHGKGILAVFSKHQIPFKGILLFADWGLETEINAQDTYGQKLSAKDVQNCFASTVARTDEHLKNLQTDTKTSHLFGEYSIVSMKKFLEARLDIPRVQEALEDFFTNNRRGRHLLRVLARESYKINRARLGLSEEENKRFALRNLVEYSTVGQSVGQHSILVVCESRTTSRSYNLPRQKHENVPVFFVKGSEEIDEGVNIL